MNFIILLHICAVLICISFIAYRFRVSFVETLPVFVCVLVLILYVLAMVHRLSWIDGIEAFAAVMIVIRLVNWSGEIRKDFGAVCVQNMTHPSFVVAILLFLAISLCTSGKVVTWWDDINFWASDVKSLYFLNGFAGKYENVAPEFGDYPPGAQLIKWWFLHLNPHSFREGFAFVGYYMMNMAFLLPILKKLRGRNVLMTLSLAAMLWWFPSIAEVYGYEGFCADLTMACVYGGFLYAVTDKEAESEVFYYGRLALYLGVLVLIKSIGFVWALFGLVFLILYRSGEDESAGRNAGGTPQSRKKKRLLLVAGLPILTGGSWMLFCLLTRRIAKTTTTAVTYITTDEYGISGYAGEFAGAFARAFVVSPLHKEKSIGLDLTPLGFYLCVCLIVILFYKAQILTERTRRVVLWFSIVSGAVFYAVIFIAHITIFATETQYLEASGMISSIERYGAPFTVGTLLFLAGIWADGGERLFRRQNMPAFVSRYGTYLCMILFVALTAGYRIGYDGLVGYRNSTADRLAERASMLDEDERQFIRAVEVLGTDHGARVCYIRRGDAPRWVNNSYLAYAVSPISVVYKSVNLSDAPTEWMAEEIRSSHAGYLYVEETDADAGAVFDEMTQSGAFSCGMIYSVADDGAGIKLTPVSQY